ncbi:DNA helicase II [Thiocapsa imhoffii]|uniref:DNA 3'-5' helicase n=1 Tax=Thiocapsa imhoffii TaxID=382777 RepID=A0A9X0WI46_9GAMM|nr:DNA helicase II [Thiocapsa imhoffii]MBK1644970.1 DNA helicase II [Thiocapsa imhoffii]
MDVSTLLDSLNDAQRAAVASTDANLLVLAGAGSGKTRVLVHRIAWLVQVEQVPNHAILAVTFTNKAAREMRARIETMLGASVAGMWVGTFHGLAHRFLRAHWQDAGLPQHFQILDADEQFRLIKRVLKALQLDEARWPPRQIQGFINHQKDDGLRPHHLDGQGDYGLDTMIGIYRQYEEERTRSGLLDFADLLLSTLELLRERTDILAHYQRRFTQILVDEFQDTNAIQYAWLRLLSGRNDNLFAVGDDDQSIYGWRGARVENIQSFQRDYPNTQVVRLEQNYRSSGNILAAANALIAHNPSRLGKTLWTQDVEGEPIRRYTAFNEVDEARFVVDRIRHLIADEGHRRSDCAILYRTTAQSRLFEEALLHAQIPYRIYGGLRFFERAEIRDALAYLRLILNQDDDAAFERAVNTPNRGIGSRTLDLVRQQALTARVSLWQAAQELANKAALGPRATHAVQGFLEFVASQRDTRQACALPEFVRILLEQAQLADFYAKSKDGKGQDRIENLEQFVDTAARFDEDHHPDEGDVLTAFLAHAALESGDTRDDTDVEGVQLMTLHSAKGLEFPIVFLVGVEEGLFPHSLSAEDPARLEEERRLCYVGMTRAMQQLYLTHAESRRLYGREDRAMPSRFLREIPKELIEDLRARGPARRASAHATSSSQADTAAFRLGQQVIHPTFGEGVVLQSEGRGTAARIQVNFRGVGSKWLILAYARLQPID